MVFSNLDFNNLLYQAFARFKEINLFQEVEHLQESNPEGGSLKRRMFLLKGGLSTGMT